MSEPQSSQPEPAPDNLDKIAVPGILVRRPRLARVIATGALAGLIAGILLATLLPGETALHRAAVTVLVSLGFALLGGLVAGAIATRPSRDTNSARVGAVLGFAIGAILVVLMPTESYRVSTEAYFEFFASPVFGPLAVVVLVGMPFFGWVIGRSFDNEGPAAEAESADSGA